MPFVSTILCVDDDEDDLLFIKETIRSRGYSFTIAEAKNGWEAINFLQKAQDDDVLPCLIIMDLNMPRMDGKQTINKIRESEKLAPIPIAVFTTSSNHTDRQYFENLGVRFMTKPFDYKIFTSQIVDLLAFCADLGS
ncbi:MAG TPA: response regulator [Flavisolibacter sp.]|nr:response regulator [Flavisolibacter sp.]